MRVNPVAEPAQPGLEGRILRRHVVAVAQEPALDPLDQVRAARPRVEVAPGLEQGVPERQRLRARAPDLDPALPGVARARDDHLRPAEGEAPPAVEAQRPHPVAEDARGEVQSHRALHRERVDVRLGHRHVVAARMRDAQDPEQQVAVGDRDPPAVGLDRKRHRVVQYPPVGAAHRQVGEPPLREAREVPRRQVLHERRRAGAGDLHLPLAGHVPDLHRFLQMPAILLHPPERGRQAHPVVDCPRAHARRLDPPGPRRASHAAREGEHRHGRRLAARAIAAAAGGAARALRAEREADPGDIRERTSTAKLERRPTGRRLRHASSGMRKRSVSGRDRPAAVIIAWTCPR